MGSSYDVTFVDHDEPHHYEAFGLSAPTLHRLLVGYLSRSPTYRDAIRWKVTETKWGPSPESDADQRTIASKICAPPPFLSFV